MIIIVVQHIVVQLFDDVVVAAVAVVLSYLICVEVYRITDLAPRFISRRSGGTAIVINMKKTQYDDFSLYRSGRDEARVNDMTSTEQHM